MLAKTADVGKKPDLLSLATPTQFHTPQIRRAVRQGINVLCEKPLTGDAQDIPGLERLQNETDKFIAVGYQWSYSKAIQTLKKDISAGRFGKAICMKSLVFWPRSRAYFTRSTGWAGKICAPTEQKFTTASSTTRPRIIYTTYCTCSAAKRMRRCPQKT